MSILGSIRQERSGAPQEATSSASGALVEWVIAQKNAGRSDDDISATLRSRGHSAQAVDMAIQQASSRLGQFSSPSMESSFSGKDTSSAPSIDMKEVERLIDERLKDLSDSVLKLQNTKISLEGELESLKAKTDHVTAMLKESKDAERVKFDEFDDHLSKVKVELKAVQEVFKQGLPEFVKAVQELKRISSKSK